jgi:hypothetical protein
MTVSRLRLRVPKSESRVISEHLHAQRRAEIEGWNMSDSTFFTMFVVLAAAIAVAALVLR